MDPILAAIILGTVAAGAGGLLYLFLRQRARSALNAHLVLEAATVRLGGAARVQVHVRPRQEVSVERVVARTRCLRRSLEGRGKRDAELLGWLSVVHSQGDDTWVEHDEVARSEMEITGPHTFRPGQAESFEVEVPLADGLPTDENGPLTIRWQVEVQFCIPNFPDATLVKPFKVLRRW